MESGAYLDDGMFLFVYSKEEKKKTNTTGFDPSKLRVADLRNIFIRHDIEYPSNAKKADLIQIFKDKIVPQAGKLRVQFESIEASGSGIVDAAQKEEEQPRRRTRSVSPHKSPSKSTTAPKSVKSTVRKTSRKKDDTIDESPTKRASSRKLDKPDLAPPSQPILPPSSPRRSGKKTLNSRPFIEPNDNKEEEKEEPKKKEETVYKISSSNRKKSHDFDHVEKQETPTNSPFSDKNVFQSGSPKESSEKKRKSHPFDADVDAEEARVLPSKRQTKKSLREEKTEKTPGGSVRHITSFSSPESDGYDSPNIPKKRSTKQQSQQQQQQQQRPPPPPLQQQQQQPQQPQSQSQPKRPQFYNQENYNTPSTQERQTIPATVQPEQVPSNFQDHTFSERKVNKRLSFMPNFHELKMSEDFKQQLSNSSTPRQSNVEQEFSTPGSTFSDNIKQESEEEEKKEPKAENNDGRAVDEEVKKLDDELEKEKKKKKKKGKSKTSKKHSKSWTFYIEQILLLFTVGITLTTFAWWRQEKIVAGYCNVGYIASESNFEEPSLFDKMLDKIRPDCTPCPLHATCYPRFRLTCDEDYIEKESPFSFAGFFPIAPKCEPDTEKQRRVMIMNGRILKYLRQRNADYVCGDADVDDAAIEQEELRQILLRERQSSISEENFNDLFEHSIKDIKQNEEVRVRKNSIIEIKNNDANCPRSTPFARVSKVASSKMANTKKKNYKSKVRRFNPPPLPSSRLGVDSNDQLVDNWNDIDMEFQRFYS